MSTEKEYGTYDAPWTKTFDLAFLFMWIYALIGLSVYTIWYDNKGAVDREFFAFGLTKIVIVGVISLIGGLICRKFCATDEKGYIIYSRQTKFKVNYTRKLQHFAAYLAPLINPFGKHEGLLPHLWETLFVMLTFLLLIKPLRESCRFFMLQFNSMDRPEDRPHTLKWIILGNLLPGLLLSVIFQNLFENTLHEPYLVMIIVLAVSIGDGLAEPVGKYLGKHKYTVPAWNFKRSYTRSYEGSACVFLTTLIAIFAFHGEFDTPQLIVALIILPPLMTFAEAFAPHSMDTPLMMLSGYSVLAIICCSSLFVEKKIEPEPEANVTIELNISSLYSQKELDDAVVLIKDKFATFTGCELHSIRYAGDEANKEENLKWLNSLREAKADGSSQSVEYVQVAEFLSNFHSPVEDGPYAWERDKEYTDYQWWLARPKDGGWEIVSWGYN